LHGELIDCPSPPHVGHVPTVTICPKNDRVERRTSPRPRLGAAPFAQIARVEKLCDDFLLHAGGDFCKRETHGDFHVVRARRASALRFAQEVAETKVAHEHVQGVGQVEVRVRLAARAAQALFAVSIVQAALLRIAKHVVCLGHFLELRLGVLGPVVLVGMILHRQTAIRLLDLVIRGSARNAEYFVVILHRP
jgi:hypothetical protein